MPTIETLGDYGITFGSQLANELVHEGALFVETTTPDVIGVRTSIVINLVAGAIASIAAIMGRRLPDNARFGLGVIGAGRLSRGLIDGAKMVTAGGAVVRVPVRIPARVPAPVRAPGAAVF